MLKTELIVINIGKPSITELTEIERNAFLEKLLLRIKDLYEQNRN